MQWPQNLRQVGKLTILVGLMFGAYGISSDLDLGKSVDPERIAQYLEEWGLAGPLIFVAMMATAVVISPIPSLPLDLAAGGAFGPFLGTTYAVLGAEVGAIISFLLGRFLGKDVVGRVLKTEVEFCTACSDRHLIGLVFFSRLLPVFSFDLVSYGAGLTNMSLKAFALATLVGMIPPTYALVYFGSSLVTLDWQVILSSAILVMIFLFLPKWIMKDRFAGWARLLQGGSSSSPKPRELARIPKMKAGRPCAWCGKETNYS